MSRDAPSYEVVTRVLRGAYVLEVMTDAPLSQLDALAERIITDVRRGRHSIIRIFFYFRGETPGEGLPRYRVQWTESETQSFDFTERRKTAGQRVE